MTPYPSISTIFKRNPATNYKSLLMYEWADPVFAYLQDNEWSFEEKVDGTNIRIMINKDAGGVELGGRTDNAQLPAPLVKNLWKLLDVGTREALVEQFPGGACLYGEGFGRGIQGKIGTAYNRDPGFTLFDVNVRDEKVEGGWWLNREAVRGIAAQFGMDFAPIRGVGTLHAMIDIVKSGLVSAYAGEVPFYAEGLIARPLVDLKTHRGDRIIAKLKMVDFLNGH